jgi:drug/metabolite transporter (DMT)-like permease
MELWFIYAIIFTLFFWVNWFIKKLITKKKIEKNNFLLFSSLMQTFLTFIYFLYNWELTNISILLICFIIIRVVLLFEKNSTSIESLKYIDSSIYFPSNILIMIWWWFFIGMFLFDEYLGFNEFLFFLFWIISILLISYKKWEFKNKNLKKWIYFMFLSSLFVIWTTTINKFVWIKYDISFYMLMSNILLIFYTSFKIKIQKYEFHINKNEILYGSLFWFFWAIWFLFYLLALKDWKLVIIQLISILDILIPIILSYIFLKEEVNRYRIIWLILFLVNLGVFYINK